MPRAIWSGSISFGLVTVPVKLYSAIAQKDISFRQIDPKTGSRIKYKRVSEKTGREVAYDQIAKGYEIEKDRYVLIDPEELEALDPEKTHTVDVEDFVDLEEIDPIYFEHTYYMAPDKGGEKAYTLLMRALQEENKVGIGRVVLRTKEYLAAIRPIGNVLALETMLFPDEIVAADEINGLPVDRARVSEREMKMAKQLIGSLATEFDPEKYHDEYRERVLELIERKAKGETLELESAEERPQVVSLIEALKASVEQAEREGSGRSRGKKGSRTRRSTGKKRSA